MTDLQTIIADSFKNDFRRLYFNAYSVTRSLPEGADAARDIVTDAYVQAMKSYTPQAGATLYTWLYRVVANRSLNHIKAHKNSRRSVNAPAVVESKWQASDVTPRPFTGPERAFLNKERRELVKAALADLCTAREVAVWEACKLDGLTTTAAADLLGVSQPTAHRALATATEKVGTYVARMSA